MADNKYDASSITILEGLEAVRKRPAMYIGDSDVTGLHHMIYEIVDNAIDEALAGFANTISISLNQDGSISITDNGRGIPVGEHPTRKVSALEVAATVLHAGGKFNGEVYKVSSGLHGVGLSVVNALSKWMTAEVFQDGSHYFQKYKTGIPEAPVKVIGKTDISGTKITFLPDPDIFITTVFNLKTLHTRFRQQAYLTAGVKLQIIDQRTDQNREHNKLLPRDYTFCFKGGVKSYVKQINSTYKSVHNNVFYIKETQENIEVEVALQYTDDIQERVMAFANNVHNPEGGTHLAGFRTAVTQSLNTYLTKEANEKDKEIKLTGDDTKEGMTAIISVKLHDPQFEGQTKIKLNNPEVTQVVRKIVKDGLDVYLEEHPKDAKSILFRTILASKARTAAKAAREAVVRKGALEGNSLPGKLADCSSKDPGICEIFIVEGDSAGGSAKQGRDRKTQAILPLFGKPLNSEKYRLDKVLQNDKLKTLVIALGAGIGDTFNEDKLRYHKIVIMADADVDGAHIVTLYLTLFYRHLRPLVEKGYVYVAQPPLYRVVSGKDEIFWINDDQELDNFKKNLEKGRTIKSIQRFKGLGEMNAEQLWETTMNPESRTLKRIAVDDAEEADKIFEVLMGNEVPPRKSFIQNHSREALLDI